ncbi:hypothetical protein EYZ11_012537 [Aspergillus tanneri]|uniref:Uncharacterized protein n=1 Tax=Aspergillus tanneri TaxID=1220188 RepID=A0A4S3J246_9EURO|nr:hypothetical protein EYZ11_012537 [Aspergillus tanneri]
MPWKALLHCVIEPHETALQGHETICCTSPHDHYIAYTDCSGHSAQGGAAAVTLRGNEVRGRYLGTKKDNTVYAAELGVRPRFRRWPTRDASAEAIYSHVRTIRQRDYVPRVIIRWIPAHVGVPGNEAADEAAKDVAIEVNTRFGGTITRLAAATKRAVRQRIRARWEKQWERERGGEADTAADQVSKKGDH